MDNLLVSIIVPVYNGEKYLADCIDSILSQTATNFELILINDGSIDKSLEICKNYVLRDKRIRLINKSNEGVSIARNCGINQSKGSLLCFIDADDLIAKDFLEKLLIASDKGSFLVGCGFKIIKNKDVRYEVRFNNEETTSALYLKSEKRNLASWGWLIPKHLLVDYNLLFEKNIIVSEDTLFMLQLLSKVGSFQTISDNGYLHRDNEYSVCNSSASFNKITSWLNVDISILKMDNHCLGKSNIDDISRSIEYSAISSLISYNPDPFERDKLLSLLNEIVYYRKISDYRKSIYINLYLLNVSPQLCALYHKIDTFLVRLVMK